MALHMTEDRAMPSTAGHVVHKLSMGTPITEQPEAIGCLRYDHDTVVSRVNVVLIMSQLIQ
jgi:hypothetical protein